MNPRSIQMAVAAASMTVVGASMDGADRNALLHRAARFVGIHTAADDKPRDAHALRGLGDGRGRLIGHDPGIAEGIGGGEGRRRGVGEALADAHDRNGGDGTDRGAPGQDDGRNGLDAGGHGGPDDEGIDGGAHDGVGGHGRLSGTGAGIGGGSLGNLGNLLGTDHGDNDRDRGHGADGNSSDHGTGTGGTTVDVPEPGMAGLFGLALAGMAIARRRRASARLATPAGDIPTA